MGWGGGGGASVDDCVLVFLYFSNCRCAETERHRQTGRQTKLHRRMDRSVSAKN